MATGTTSESVWAYRFTRLTELLAQWQWLWAPAPFTHRGSPWQPRSDEESQWVTAISAELAELDDGDCERLQHEPYRDSPLASWLPVAELQELIGVPATDVADGSFPQRWAQHVSGRKWQQMVAFVPHVAAPRQGGLVEWCAGKGHLGRLMARCHQQPVVGLEWQSALCRDGQQLADRQQLPVEMVCQDVMQPDVECWLSSQGGVAALHACGDLHVRLIELVRQKGTALTLAPCCYQRTQAEYYRPLSSQGQMLSRDLGLGLTREHLALAVQETVTASRGERRKRERGNAWRLGFDELQRELRGSDDYLPVPSLAYGRMPEQFADFCRWAGGQKRIEIPGEVDWSHYESRGWQRLRLTNRQELVRHLFRRPLEIWLVLDRVLWLEEAGFEVELVEFCAAELTPRNLLIKALPRR
ncbi:SAM-dependent methyltransferase [Halomonas cupida]|nr:methyltransferase [Halomonas cupida]GEN22451.1 SAM-dependent methyltransferase [Halomonas cupida]